MVQDNNEHKIPQEGNDHLSPSEMEKLKNELKKEHDEAVNLSKRSKAEILHELEKSYNADQKEAMKNMLRHADFPEIHPEGNNSPEYRELQEIFTEIQTDHVEYPFFRRVFPNFIHVCESSRIGQSFSHDVLGLALGIGESLVSVVKLAGHMTLDTAKLIVSPRKSYRETKEIVS